MAMRCASRIMRLFSRRRDDEHVMFARLKAQNVQILPNNYGTGVPCVERGNSVGHASRSQQSDMIGGCRGDNGPVSVEGGFVSRRG